VVDEDVFLALLSEAATLPGRAGALNPVVRVGSNEYPTNTVVNRPGFHRDSVYRVPAIATGGD
jgi:hypothetical protein